MHPASPELGRLLARKPVALLMELLNGDGAETRIVGGAVRNILLDLTATDIDLTTSLKPDEVMARAAKAGIKTVPTGLKHGTVTLVLDKTPFEVTTLRRDVETDGRHAVVAFADSFEEDAVRRDFTINQLSLSVDGTVHDYAGGLADLAARKIRFIGDARRRITEDYLRILRFFRFHAAYGAGPLDAEALQACDELKGGMARLSAERIWSELKRLLAAQGAPHVMRAFVGGRIWQAMAGHVVADLPAFEAAATTFPRSDSVARLAALAVRTADDVAALDARLKFAAHERKRLADVAQLLEKWPAPEALNERALRLASLNFGPQAVHDALCVWSAALGEAQARAFADVQPPPNPFMGREVLALGVPAGPDVGRIIQHATEMWADLGFAEDPALRAQCLQRAASG